MVFSSYRPAPGDTSAHPSAYLWYVEREGLLVGQAGVHGRGECTGHITTHSSSSTRRGDLYFNRSGWDYGERLGLWGS